jgi:hypothetical protein
MKRRKKTDCTPPPIQLLQFLFEWIRRFFEKKNVLNSYEQDELELEELEKEEKRNWDESDLV